MIFILGANGFVGSAFVRYCQKLGKAHQAITRANYAEFKGQECDVFVNANGNSSKILSREKPLEDFQMSVESVLKSTLDFRFRKYIFLSSCDVYSKVERPQDNAESAPIPIEALSRYGFHKYLAENVVRHGLKDWVIFRLGGMVGPGLKKNAIFDILQGGPLWLDPNSELQFMHTDDVARLAMSVGEKHSREVINLCGRGVASLRQCMKWAGQEVPARPGSPKVRYEINTDYLQSLSPVPATAETLERFISEARARS